MLSLAISVLLAAQTVQVPDLGPDNFAQWSEYLRPKPAELSFEDCEWKPTFWEGVVEAQASGKPILLWAMNGHPMACT